MYMQMINAAILCIGRDHVGKQTDICMLSVHYENQCAKKCPCTFRNLGNTWKLVNHWVMLFGNTLCKKKRHGDTDSLSACCPKLTWLGLNLLLIVTMFMIGNFDNGFAMHSDLTRVCYFWSEVQPLPKPFQHVYNWLVIPVAKSLYTFSYIVWLIKPQGS